MIWTVPSRRSTLDTNRHYNPKYTAIMALRKTQSKKLYYSVREVSQMLGEPESTLKHWEREFPHTSPQRSPGGVRQYTERNIESLRVVRKLLRDKGLTIEGARHELFKRKTSHEYREQALTTLRSALAKLETLDAMLRGESQ